MADVRRFIATLIVAGVAAAAVGAFLFDLGNRDSLSREVGSALLQLGLIGVGGADVVPSRFSHLSRAPNGDAQRPEARTDRRVVER